LERKVEGLGNENLDMGDDYSICCHALWMRRKRRRCVIVFKQLG
jgi:hypothetical protein